MKWVVWIPVVVLLFACVGEAQRLPRTVTPEHYIIRLTPDFQTQEFAGDETIVVRVLKPTSSITLNALDIEFDKVTIASNGAKQTAKVSSDASRQMATLSVDKILRPGKAQIHIVFTGTLNNKLRGFYLAHADHRPYAITQFEPTSARMAFPCFDEPEMKATFALTAVVPKGDTAISNGRIVSDTPGPGADQHTLKFSTSPKMSSYLVALAVGRFDFVEGTADGIPIRIWFTPDKRKALAPFALQSAERFLSYYDNYFTTKYQFGKLDIVAVPDFEAGAMENTAAIFSRESLLLIDPKTSSFSAKREVALVIAHEMAHMWFGDLVTMEWWNDIWLNEGFASWMETKALEAWKPSWDLRQSDARSSAKAMAADSLETTRPIRAPKADTPAEINALFDSIAYDKTAAVLRMLEAYLGPQNFRSGVNSYVKKYQDANATASDLWDALAAVSKKPVSQTMENFVNQPGVPVVSEHVACHDGTASVTLSQRRYFYSAGLFNGGTNELWRIPVCMKWSGPSGTASASRCVLLKARQQTFTLPKCASWVFLNAGARGYYRSGYDTEALQQIEKVAEEDLTPPERIQLLGDEWALVRIGRAPISDFLNLAEAIRGDQATGVMQVLAGHLQYIGQYLVNGSDQAEFQTWVRNLLRPEAQKLGWQAAPNENPERQVLRATVLRILGVIGHDPTVLAKARELAKSYLENPASVDPDLVSTVLGLAAIDGNQELYDEYLARDNIAKTPENYDRYLYALTDFCFSSLVKRTLEHAMSPNVRSQDVASLISAVMQNPAGRELGWDYVKIHWLPLANKMPTYGGVGLINATGSFCSSRDRNDVQQFFNRQSVPGGQRALKQALETIGYCVDLKSQQQTRLASWLGAQKVQRGQ